MAMPNDTVFVYHEYRDDMPYETQSIMTFADETKGKEWLRQRVESYFHMTWDNLAANLDEDDILTDDYVNIMSSKGSSYFVLERSIIA